MPVRKIRKVKRVVKRRARPIRRILRVGRGFLDDVWGGIKSGVSMAAPIVIPRVIGYGLRRAGMGLKRRKPVRRVIRRHRRVIGGRYVVGRNIARVNRR